MLVRAWLAFIENASSQNAAALYQNLIKQLFLGCFYYLKNKQNSEDLAHDIFCFILEKRMCATNKLLDDWKRYDIELWLYFITRRFSTKELKKRKSRQKFITYHTTISSQYSQPFTHNLEIEFIFKAVDNIENETHRKIINLHLEGFNNGEISKLINKDEGWVRRVKSRALIKFRNQLTNNYQL